MQRVMRRRNHLFDRILEIDNLHLAFWKARKGKEAKREVVRYRSDFDSNIRKLREELASGNVEVGHYNCFKIFDPKERVICATPFSQRVMHHALMNVCTPVMESYQIFDSYANRKGKGTFAAIERARSFHKKFAWCVKLDVRKYFDSIDHDVLREQLARLFREEHLLRIFYAIIGNYEVLPAKGLPIGNLTSQYFANHYLAVADHFAKEKLGVKGYVRYMDDVLMFGNERDALLLQAKQFREFIVDGLKLELKVFNLQSTARAVAFCGFRITKGPLLLSRRSKRRYREKLRLYRENFELGRWSEDDYARHLQPVVAFAMKADSRTFRRSVGMFE